MKITNALASKNILAACDNNTLIQSEWHTQHEGREMACLLGSIHPKVKSAKDCNAELMPLWLAEVTVRLFDGLPADQLVPVARRYGALVGRWHILTAQQWDMVMAQFMMRCVDDALEAARPVSSGKDYWPKVEAASKAVLALYQEWVTTGVKPVSERFREVRAAAYAAYVAAAAAYAADAAAATYATYAAYAAAYAAYVAAAAAYAADAAAAATHAAYAAAYAADAAAAAYAAYVAADVSERFREVRAAAYADAAYAAAAAAAYAAAYVAAARSGKFLNLFTFLLDLIEKALNNG